MSESTGQHGDHDDGERPSFKTFLKQCKDVATAGKGLKFLSGRKGAKAVGGSAEAGSVDAGADSRGDPADDDALTRAPPPPADEDPSALAAKRRAQARRAQVRRAQVQHRKRKADYTKQLETEVTDRRNMIADLDAECALLKRENDVARALLAAASVVLPPRWQDEEVVSPSGSGSQPVSHFADIEVDDLVVSLAIDEAMGTQTWRVSRAPSPLAAAGSDDSRVVEEESEDVPGCGRLSPAQTQQAINLILAMEHCCKDHFRLADLDPDLHETWGLPEPSSQGQDEAPATGHHMMATTLALREAPSSIAADARSSLPGGPAARVSELPAGPDGCSWRASGLTLAALHGLAQSLAPLAGPELTPVQAWFELAGRFPAELLLRPDVSDGLKREFVGAVKCLHFGAAVEREAFESIVYRVLEVGGSPSAGINNCE